MAAIEIAAIEAQKNEEKEQNLADNIDWTSRIYCEPIACLASESAVMGAQAAQDYLNDKLLKLLPPNHDLVLFKVFGIDHLELVERLLNSNKNKTGEEPAAIPVNYVVFANRGI